jgi:hypothetical protein
MTGGTGGSPSGRRRAPARPRSQLVNIHPRPRPSSPSDAPACQPTAPGHPRQCDSYTRGPRLVNTNAGPASHRLRAGERRMAAGGGIRGHAKKPRLSTVNTTSGPPAESGSRRSPIRFRHTRRRCQPRPSHFALSQPRAPLGTVSAPRPRRNKGRHQPESRFILADEASPNRLHRSGAPARNQASDLCGLPACGR